MLLYDGQSQIDWFYDALLTADEMMGRDEYARIFDGPAVLYDNGEGKVYGWDALETLCGKWSVPFTDDADSTFSALVEAMNSPAEQDKTPELAVFASIQLMSMSPAMDDATALTIPSLFAEWAVGIAYEAKQIVRHGGELYRIAQAHTSQAQWVPGEAGTESLYTHIAQSGGYDVWQQPTGAHDAYAKGTKVWYPTADSTLYESLIDGNTTIPGSDERWWKVVSQ